MAHNRGHLVVIGGAEDRQGEKRILGRFVELAGGPKANIVVLTAASRYGDELERVYEEAFRESGAGKVRIQHIADREEANSGACAAQVFEASGVFMTGGEQKRLMSTLGGSETARAMHRAFRERATVVAGTSAGASALSEHMVASGRPGLRPVKGMLDLRPGLGFLTRVIIDQHFSERHRQSRLLSTIAQNPYLLGVGIDEDTALVIEPNAGVEVVGEGAVTLLDGRDMTYTNVEEVEADDLITLAAVRLYLLPAGFACYYGDPDRMVGPASMHEVVKIVAGFPREESERAAA